MINDGNIVICGGYHVGGSIVMGVSNSWLIYFKIPWPMAWMMTGVPLWRNGNHHVTMSPGLPQHALGLPSPPSASTWPAGAQAVAQLVASQGARGNRIPPRHGGNHGTISGKCMENPTNGDVWENHRTTECRILLGSHGWLSEGKLVCRKYMKILWVLW